MSAEKSILKNAVEVSQRPTLLTVMFSAQLLYIKIIPQDVFQCPE